MIPITKTTDLLKAKPINEHILKFGRNEVNLEVAKYVNKCIVGLGLTMDNYAIQILIEDLVDKYKYDSIEDIQECLKKGRRGDYGAIYGVKLNMIVISKWMEKHLQLKMDVLERAGTTAGKGTDIITDEIRAKYEEFANQGVKNQAEEKERKESRKSNQLRFERESEEFKIQYEKDVKSGKINNEGTIKPETK